ncbi:copper resistance CopC/CopD family protein [Wenjunlia tyrosinilytica]|uniref:Protein YobA n=1 Tax=Wenjunlia tyrosinilytica TaxID=1544741 RepID=A0A917ZN19_9ACTN|nr:copper resistance protein CopC [Wenjunlia tyrosinilytica]GGO86433.1 transport integral membrane protein [Wenjunlia tyrosinilytica]
MASVSAPRRPARARRAGALLVVLGTAIAVLLASALPASAHAALIGTDPAQGSIVQTAPQQVTLTFSESVIVSAGSVRVLDPEGKQVDDGRARHADGRNGTARARLHAGLPDGTFTVAWHVVSADSHPISGAFTFSIGKQSATKVSVQAPTVGGGAAGGLYDTARYLAYGGFALLVGAAGFTLVCWSNGGGRRPMQRLLLTGWSALLVCTIAQLMLRGPYESGSGVGDAFDLEALRATLETKPGAALAVRLLLLAGAGAFLAVLVGQSERKAQRDVRLGLIVAGEVLAVGLASTWAVMEHASVGLQTGVAIPVDVVHLVAMATWLGGLAALLTALYVPDGPQIETEAVERFSKIAFTCVVLLVGTGVYQSWRQVGSWNALGSTHYGKLLIAKLVAVAALLCAGWYSRRWTRRMRTLSVADSDSSEPVTFSAEVKKPAAKSGNPARAAELARQRAAIAAARAKRERDANPNRSMLRGSVVAEVAIAVVVLTITTLLTTTEPARTVEESGAQAANSLPRPAKPVNAVIPYDTGGKNGKGTATVDLDPARKGDNVLHVRLTDTKGAPVDVAELKVAFTLKKKALGPLAVGLEHIDVGHWTAGGVQLPLSGTWELSVSVRTSDIDEVTETKKIEIG